MSARYPRPVRAVVLLLLCAGCAEPRPHPRELAVATDEEAAQLVDRFLRAVEHGHVETAASFLCEQDDASQRRAQDLFRAGGAPFSAASHEVVAASAKWQGATPFFYVEVAAGGARHGFHLRAEPGCIAGLLGPATAPVDAAPAPPAPETTMDAVDL
jgi:hypothetical protein